MKGPASIRARTTLAATLVFAFALTIAGFGLVWVLRTTMIDNVDSALALRATDIGALLEAGTPPARIAVTGEEDSFVQVIATNNVIAASANIQGQAPISEAPVGSVFTLNNNPVDDSPFRVLISQTETPSGSVRVIVGNTTEGINDTISTVIQSLAVGLPLLLGVASLMTWTVVGRALRPVERIRAEVAEIGATDLHRRVPQPETRDEIEQLATTMNDMLGRIESDTLRQRRFVSDASHELRTPIAIIRHEIEVGLQQPDATNWALVAADVLEEDLRMQRLVDDLLWLARHDQRHEPLASVLVDLDELALDHARPSRYGVAISVDTTGIEAGQVRGNPDELGRVLQNLIDNGLRHASRHLDISVTTSDHGTVLLHVDDDGPGVSEQFVEQIFERFTRGDLARARDHGGAGLGLAIAAEIATAHGGTLTVRESPRGGARFTLELDDARH